VIERLEFCKCGSDIKERDIRLTEARDSRARDFASLITVRAQTPDGEREVSGALFDGKNPRLVRVNGFSLEAIPKGHMVVLFNQDVPGVIGKIATLLGDRGINIGRFHLGRKEEIGGIAVAIIQVDTPLSAEQLAEVAQLPNVRSAKQVHLA